MKNKSYLDYMILFNQPSGRKMRSIQRKFGTVLVWEIIIAAVCLSLQLALYLSLGENDIWFKSFFVIIFILVLKRDDKSTFGMFVSAERKNLFFRTVPERNEVLKKAMITAEAGRFLTIFVYWFFTEVFDKIISHTLRADMAVLDFMITYIFCVSWVNFKRMNCFAGITTLLILFSALFMSASVTSASGSVIPGWVSCTAAVLSVPVAAAAGFLLNRWSYRSLCNAGGTE